MLPKFAARRAHAAAGSLHRRTRRFKIWENESGQSHGATASTIRGGGLSGPDGRSV